jgi:hypothetical protein
MAPTALATRRTALTFIASVALAPLGASAAARPRVTVHKDPNCGCCSAWVKHLEAAGFPVTAIDTPRLNAVKARLGVPADLHACHTAEVDGYIVEGHVPAAAIDRLLTERPGGKGLAVPGMPVGSPGMEIVGSPPEEYTVFIFGDFGKRQYARFKEAREIGVK